MTSSIKAVSLVLMLFWGCQDSHQRYSTLQDDTVPADATDAALLGQGYDTDRESFLGSCVKGHLRYSGASEATIKLDRSMSYDELLSELGVEVGGKASFEVIDVSGKSSFAINAATTEYRESLVFMTKIQGKNAVLDDVQLNARGEDTKGMDPKKVRKRCGNNFVQQIQLGGKLLINVSLEFANRELKTKFHTEASLDMAGLLEISGKIDTALEKYAKNTTIKITALQIGGKPEDLTTILKKNEDNEKLHFMRCSIENRQACVAALERIVNYASNEFPDQFGDMTYDPQTAYGPAFLSYQTKSYYDYGLTELYPDPSPIMAAEIIAMRARLLETHRSLSKYGQRSFELLNHFRLSDEEVDRIQKIYRKIERNKAKVVKVGQLCYEKPNFCVENAVKLYADSGPESLEEYNPKDLMKELVFYDYCVMPSTTASARKTVNQLAKYVGMENESCEAIEAELLALTSVDLANADLTSLKPLKGLSRLKRLKLRRNNIGNISTLAQLPGLTYLDLSHNRLDNVLDLEDLSQLKFLDVSFNQLYEVHVLSNLTNLEILKVHGNSWLDEQAVAPLRALPKLSLFYGSVDELCRIEREYAHEKGWVDGDDYERYKTYNLAPVYIGAPRVSRIDDWYVCHLAAAEY